MSRSTEWQRTVDFWAGVPLILLLRAFRRRRPLPRVPKMIGFLSPSAIGDLVLDTGLMVHIRNRYPEAQLHLYHGASNASLVPLLPVRVIGHLCNFKDFRATLTLLRKSRLDILVDLTPWPRLTALYAGLSGAATVGFSSQGQSRHYAFDVRVPHLRSQHEADNLRAMAETFGPCLQYVPSLRRVDPPAALPAAYSRLVLCHVAPGGSQAAAKAWPKANWAALARHLAAAGFAVGFTGAAADGPEVGRVLELAGLPEQQAFSLCGKLTLVELAGALQACRLCVTVDTGVMHMASTLDVPTIALFGPSHSRRWGGQSPRTKSLDAPHADAGYIHLGFESVPKAAEIMPTLTVAMVCAAVESALTTNSEFGTRDVHAGERKACQ